MGELRKRAHRIVHVTFFFTYLSTAVYAVLIPRIYMVYYSKTAFDKYWPLLIFWKIQFDVSTYLVLGALTSSLCYFALICYVFR